MVGIKAKKVSDSAIHDQTYKVFPTDLNSNDTVFGGLVMGILDRVALVVAERHSERVCVTVSVDSMHFLAPARKGDILIFRAAINRSWRTSMEIGVKVMSEHFSTGEHKHVLSAYFTFVALDEHCRPVEVPQVIPELPIEKRRYEEAEIRRGQRKQEREERLQRRQEFEL
jgi:acyl-CoA hydrolase